MPGLRLPADTTLTRRREWPHPCAPAHRDAIFQGIAPADSRQTPLQPLAGHFILDPPGDVLDIDAVLSRVQYVRLALLGQPLAIQARPRGPIAPAPASRSRPHGTKSRHSTPWATERPSNREADGPAMLSQIRPRCKANGVDRAAIRGNAVYNAAGRMSSMPRPGSWCAAGQGHGWILLNDRCGLESREVTGQRASRVRYARSPWIRSQPSRPSARSGRAIVSQTTYVVGEVYYQFGFARVVEGGDPRLLVNTWRYDGVSKPACSSRECEVPHPFHGFTMVTGVVDALGDDATSIETFRLLPCRAKQRELLFYIGNWSYLRSINLLGEHRC